MDGPVETRPIARRLVLEVRGGQRQQREIETVVEEPLAVRVNGKQVAILMRLPGDEKELAVGFCVSEGLVRNARRYPDRASLWSRVVGDASGGSGDGRVFSRNAVELRVDLDGVMPDARLDVVRLIRAGCGGTDLNTAGLTLPVIESEAVVSDQTITALGAAFRGEQLLHNAVGGVHDAALFDLDGNLLCLAEDIGRHNAVDKVLGYCLLRRIVVRDRILLCSGRLSYEMVAKAVRVGVPLLVSLSAPTALAAELADRSGLTLIGYLRGGRMTIYTHAERVVEGKWDA